jgi:hypothetical protein
MHEVVVRSPIRYMGACTSVHAHNQSRVVHWNHAPKSFMQQTNIRAGWKPKVQRNKTPCIIVSWLRWACTTPPSRTKTSWATNHPLNVRASPSGTVWPPVGSKFPCRLCLDVRKIYIFNAVAKSKFRFFGKYCPTIAKLDSKDSGRKGHHNCVISFWFHLHLVFRIYVFEVSVFLPLLHASVVILPLLF